MRARLLLAVLVGLWTSVAVEAEPVKAPVHKAEQPVDKGKPIVIASAGEMPAEIATPEKSDAAIPPRQRRARVTTCRCGDPSAKDD